MALSYRIFKYNTHCKKLLLVSVVVVVGALTGAHPTGNTVAIVFGGLLNKLGKSKPNLSGEGKMLHSQSSTGFDDKEEDKKILQLKIME